MHNTPEESGSRVLRSKSLKSGKGVNCLVISVNRFTDHLTFQDVGFLHDYKFCLVLVIYPLKGERQTALFNP